jgi:6-phosphogluconolactonase
MGAIHPEISISADANSLSRAAAKLIVRQIGEQLQRKEYFAIALSGGSTPKSLFNLLAKEPAFNTQVPWDKIHFFWGDERHVPPDHPESNYRMANETMLSKLPIPQENIHRVMSENSDADNAATQYEQELHAFFHLTKGQMPRFDCILLGMGPDGHTASLFPETSALLEKERLVIANWVEKFESYRITMTAPVFNNADCVIFMVSGEKKAETLQAVLQGEKQPYHFPAQLIQPAHGRLLWIIDRAAARKLNVQVGE